jgi:predicted transcriptional regulator
MRRLVFLVSLPILALLLPDTAAALHVGDPAPAFCLKDAHGRTHRLTTFTRRILVVWYEGVKSRHENQWIKNRLAELQRAGRLNDQHYESVGIANFDETVVPGALLESAIRQHTLSSAVRILLDRDGSLRRAWGFHHGRSNIYVFDARRRLIWRSSGPLTRRLGRQLVRMIVRRAR